MASVPNTDQYMSRCICGDCENFKEFGLSKGYHCVEGSAGETEE